MQNVPTGIEAGSPLKRSQSCETALNKTSNQIFGKTVRREKSESTRNLTDADQFREPLEANKPFASFSIKATPTVANQDANDSQLTKVEDSAITKTEVAKSTSADNIATKQTEGSSGATDTRTIPSNAEQFNETSTSSEMTSVIASNKDQAPSIPSMITTAMDINEHLTVDENDKQNEALQQIKGICNDVISSKNKGIKSRIIPEGIAKFFSVASILAGVAIILFITLTQPALLIFAISLAALALAATTLLTSSLYTISAHLNTNKDKCHAFIANMMQDMKLDNIKNLNKDSAELYNLKDIINNYLKNSSIPIKLNPFTNLISLKRTNIDEQTKDNNAKENVKKLLDDFIEILEISVRAGHREAKDITPEFITALRADIATYINELTAGQVIDLMKPQLRVPQSSISVDERARLISKTLPTSHEEYYD
jgi:hypothetical protein